MRLRGLPVEETLVQTPVGALYCQLPWAVVAALAIRTTPAKASPRPLLSRSA